MEKTFAGMEFDIILDDGSHINDDVIQSFKIMFPKIRKGGVYIAEDLQTSYWSNHYGYRGGLEKRWNVH
jgi:demethylmacrocin O-methyltransferase